MNPLVSICIPVYNAGPYLDACLQSVFLQSLPDSEIIAIDDGSSDSSLKTLQDYALRYPQLKVSVNPVNLGLVGNWNRCLELACGTWIKFVFQDDLLDPDCISKMVEAGNRGGGGLVVCRREFLLEENASAELKHYFQHTILTPESIFANKVPEYLSASAMSALSVKYMSLNFIGEPSTILFKKMILQETGLFDARLSQICDLEFCLRLATREGMTYVPETLVQFRVHANSATSSNTTRKRFSSLYSDPAMLSYKMLYDPVFKPFRSALSFIQKFKLRLYHSMKLYEAHLFLSSPAASEAISQSQILRELPGFERGSDPGIITRLAYLLAKARRKQTTP